MTDIDIIIFSLEIAGYFTSIFGVVILFLYSIVLLVLRK